MTRNKLGRRPAPTSTLSDKIRGTERLSHFLAQTTLLFSISNKKHTRLCDISNKSNTFALKRDLTEGNYGDRTFEEDIDRQQEVDK